MHNSGKQFLGQSDFVMIKMGFPFFSKTVLQEKIEITTWFLGPTIFEISQPK